MFIDVIIPVFNALSQTARAIESVLKHSSGEFRLLLVNDRSDELTSQYLRSAAADPRVVLLENAENGGFIKTVNKGMLFSLNDQKCNAAAVILLNSDTVVTDGWLDRFRECFASDQRSALPPPFPTTPRTSR